MKHFWSTLIGTKQFVWYSCQMPECNPLLSFLWVKNHCNCILSICVPKTEGKHFKLTVMSRVHHSQIWHLVCSRAWTCILCDAVYMCLLSVKNSVYSCLLHLTNSIEQCPWEGNSPLASQESPTFYGSQIIITMFTTAHYFSLSWSGLIQSWPNHPISLRFILVLSSCVCVGLPSGYYPLFFPTKTL